MSAMIEMAAKKPFALANRKNGLLNILTCSLLSTFFSASKFVLKQLFKGLQGDRKSNISITIFNLCQEKK
jgi:TM2 domain-containing membrane protein YozV